MARHNLIERCFPCKLSQRRDFARVRVGWQTVEFNFLAHNVFLRLVCWPLLVTWRVQNDKSEDVNVPHTIDAREESRSKFQSDVVVKLPSRFCDLSEYKADDRQESAKECGEHEEFEAVDDALVVKPTQFTHRWQY